MKKVRIASSEQLDNNTIHVVMYLKPVFFENSPIFSDISFDPQKRKYLTSTNPQRTLNGPLSGPGEELGYPLRGEWQEFIDDCIFLIKECGFTIISQETSETSKKSEYVLLFGMTDDPYGKLVFDLRISDHPLDAKFPPAMKAKALNYLKINKLLDADIVEDRVAFVVEKVTVGAYPNDSWNRAFNRLFLLLKKMRNKVRAKLNVERN